MGQSEMLITIRIIVDLDFALTDFAALIGGTARNPSLRKELFNTAILGFALLSLQHYWQLHHSSWVNGTF